MAGVISTKMCMEIDFEELGHQIYDFVFDDELRIRKLIVFIFENIFALWKNDKKEEIINKHIETINGLVKSQKAKTETVLMHGNISILITILYSASYDIPSKTSTTF